MSSPLVPLPNPGEQTPEAFMQMSRRALQQSRLHLKEGDRLQASEKVSGAVASATKGIAELRSWLHDSHALRSSVISQLGAELGRSTPDAQSLYRGRAAANEQHQNYYDNVSLEDDILRDIGFAEAFVQVMERVMSQTPKALYSYRGLGCLQNRPAYGTPSRKGRHRCPGLCQLYR